VRGATLPAPAAAPLPSQPGELRGDVGRNVVVRDDWIAEDKAQHLAMSYALTTFGYAGARIGGMSSRNASAAAIGAAAAAGVAKELLDRHRGGIFSYRDLVADALGIAAGVLVISATR